MLDPFRGLHAKSSTSKISVALINVRKVKPWLAYHNRAVNIYPKQQTVDNIYQNFQAEIQSRICTSQMIYVHMNLKKRTLQEYLEASQVFHMHNQICM